MVGTPISATIVRVTQEELEEGLTINLPADIFLVLFAKEEDSDSSSSSTNNQSSPSLPPSLPSTPSSLSDSAKEDFRQILQGIPHHSADPARALQRSPASILSLRSTPSRYFVLTKYFLIF